MARMAMIGYARVSTTDQNPEAQAARQYDRSAITVDAAYQAATRSVTATAAIVMARRQCGSRAAMMRVATAAASSAHSPIPPAHTQACAVAHGVHAPELQLYLPVQSDPMRERLRNIRRDQPTDAPPDSMTQITPIADARPMQPGRLPSGFVMRAPETGDTEQLGQLYFDSHVPGSDHKFAADRSKRSACSSAANSVTSGQTRAATDQKFRRQGLARGLLSRCLNQAARTVRPNVALRADTGNTPAVRLYQAMGFRPYHPDR